MKKISLFFTLMAISLIWTGCNEDDDKDVTPNNTALLTAKSWKLIGYTVNPPLNFGGTQISDLFVQMPCYQDDNVKFDKNGSMTFNNGSNKCFSGEPETVVGSWVFNPAETVITTSAAGYEPTSYNLVELTSTSLKVTDQETDENNIVYTFTRIFSNN